MHYTQNKSKRMSVCSGVEQAKNQSKKPAPIERPAEKIFLKDEWKSVGNELKQAEQISYKPKSTPMYMLNECYLSFFFFPWITTTTVLKRD